MVYAFGIGEVPISVSGAVDRVGAARADGAERRRGHAARSAPPRPGDVLGVRGPFGTGWPVAEAAGADVVVVAGGIGLAPLRPRRSCTCSSGGADYGELVLLYGARTPGDLLYRDELDRWSAARVAST